MVERFNQTLKAILRKFVSDTGAKWDHWLPYLLFAYREVPQTSTGYSPFELLYGRQVRGPLDILRDAWMGESPQSPTNIMDYVLKMRDKLEELSTLAHDNQTQAQVNQKAWYDRTARSRTFNPSQKVLLLLPSSESSLLAKWQGPFEVLRKMGPVNYEVAMPDRQIIPGGLFREESRRTTLTLKLTAPGPIRQTSLRVPARLIPALKQEVQSLLEMGVIVPSRSEWCSPVVLVPKKDRGYTSVWISQSSTPSLPSTLTLCQGSTSWWNGSAKHSILSPSTCANSTMHTRRCGHS